MLVVAAVVLTLLAVKLLVLPIVGDFRGRARDDHWLKTEANNAQGGLSYEEWCRKTGM
jgi:hypothetical protein